MVLSFIALMTKDENINKVTKFVFLFLLFLSFIVGESTERQKELALHHFMQGEFLTSQGNYALAILEFQDAIALDPNAATIHITDAWEK